MPRMKYLKGSLRSNFIARNVARENAPCTGNSLSYQLYRPGVRFSKVLVTFSRPTQMTNQYISLRLASSPHPLEGHTHAQNGIFDSILDTSSPQPDDKQDGGSVRHIAFDVFA